MWWSWGDGEKLNCHSDVPKWKARVATGRDNLGGNLGEGIRVGGRGCWKG